MGCSKSTDNGNKDAKIEIKRNELDNECHVTTDIDTPRA